MGKPTNPNDYIKVGGKLNTKLQQSGFQPVYKDDDGFFYYLETQEIRKFVRFRRFL